MPLLLNQKSKKWKFLWQLNIRQLKSGNAMTDCEFTLRLIFCDDCNPSTSTVLVEAGGVKELCKWLTVRFWCISCSTTGYIKRLFFFLSVLHLAVSIGYQLMLQSETKQDVMASSY